MKPYGQNAGDIYLCEGTEIQRRLDADGTGLKAVILMVEENGEVVESVFTTADPEIIAEARQGQQRLWDDFWTPFGHGAQT